MLVDSQKEEPEELIEPLQGQCMCVLNHTFSPSNSFGGSGLY